MWEGQGGYDLFLYDLTDRLFVPLTDVNTASNERNPSLGAGGFVISFESDRAGGIGGVDIWNHHRGTGDTGQGTELSSTGSDLAPSLRWP